MKNKISILFVLVMIMTLFAKPVFAQTTDDYPEYIVESGDTLSGIAARFHVSMEDIQLLNNLSDPNNIYPELHLKIPGYPGMSGVISQVTLGLGESWQDLLVKYNADEQTIIKINNLLSTTDLYAGTDLLMLVKPESTPLNIVAIMDDNSTLLEKSVSLNMNPYSVISENKKQSPLDFFVNDPIFNSNPDLPKVNSISQMIESLTISPLPLSQGDTILVKLKSNQPIALSGELNSSPLHFFSEDNLNYFALIGIHAMATPGVVGFTIQGSDGTNELFSYSQDVQLVEGIFDSDPTLHVDPEMIDPAITVPELEKISSIISIYTPEKYWTGPFISPDTDYALEIPDYEAKREITSSYGTRRTYNDDPTITFHTGVDFGGGIDLPIVASAAGKVVFAGFLDVRGNATIIDHGLGVFSAYYHQKEIFVKTGDIVEKGQQIGKVGNTGRVDRANEYAGAGAHLHWEIWVNGIQVDPFEWLNIEYP